MSTRKIKDAKDLTTDELIYFKGHAKATYMSDGRTVEEAVSEMSGGTGGAIDTSNLATKGELAQKQDIISDIDTISASFALSTCITFVLGLIVLFVNISAFLARLPCSSNISSEHNK